MRCTAFSNRMDSASRASSRRIPGPIRSLGRSKSPATTGETKVDNRLFTACSPRQRQSSSFPLKRSSPKKKTVRYLKGMADGPSLEAWMELYRKAGNEASEEAWRTRYDRRANAFQYARLHYILEKT